MKRFKRIGIVVIVGIIMILGFGIENQFSGSLSSVFVPEVQARVGRPLTPVSVAGVARRTVRRCAVGVYNCEVSTPDLLDCSLAGIDFLTK